ncbi:cytochrome P450 [Dictyobacter alpinus]|uniref:Cytochrome P450 n=1 Tax=Dictyobacter alpinus TaxID=2014873 RepID=A0A402BK38_9CHLR|nr:cytochrome P450 [Dictyobacter alpinus]GCE31713.1 cytochrome P450 [Dictyobacter alpinus]
MTEMTFATLISQENKKDPHAFYAHLRATEPIFYVQDLNTWIVTTYEDALLVLRDPRFTKDNRKIVPSEKGLNPMDETAAQMMRNMLMVDAPDHTRLRSLVSKAFTPRMIEQLRPRIQQIADELLDAVQDRGQMDLIADFAYPLPLTVILEMLGIPSDERQQFRTWTQAIVNVEDPQFRVTSLQAFLGYIKTLVDKKRRYPEKDLVSSLAQVEENGDQLNENELISMIFLLIVAGHETTVNLLGNGTLALLQHQDQFQLLRREPALIPEAVEELLRYTAPVSLSDERWASEDIILHGQLIHKGDMVLAALISANADPHHIADGDTLDVTRHEKQHLAFGKGIHYCLGAPLARLEGQIAFATLLKRLPELRLADNAAKLTWVNNPMLRGLTSLPVLF